VKFYFSQIPRIFADFFFFYPYENYFVILRNLTVRWTMKNLKTIPLYSLRFFIPLRSIQNDFYAFPVILRNSPKANDEESKKHILHFYEILPRLRRVRMTILLSSVILRSLTVRWTTKNLKSIPSYSLRFFIPLRSIQNDTYAFPVILRNSPKANDEESINNSFILFKILHSASLHSE